MSGSHANGEWSGVWSMLSEELAAVTIAERAKGAHTLLSHQNGIDLCVRTAVLLTWFFLLPVTCLYCTRKRYENFRWIL